MMNESNTIHGSLLYNNVKCEISENYNAIPQIAEFQHLVLKSIFLYELTISGVV